MALLPILYLALLAVAGTAQQHPQLHQQQHQQPLKDTFDLISALKTAEIIPNIIDTFTPKLTLNISWKHATASTGNTVDPQDLQEPPNITLSTYNSAIASPDDSLRHEVAKLKDMQLTLALTDPDAPSHTNPEWSEMCHWITTLPPPNTATTTVAHKEWSAIMPYKPPGPPPKTGKHRYVFVLLAPSNRTTEPLDLTLPGNRQYWGYGKKGEGVRRWAGENGLFVIGANFVYAQNAEQ
ncbi:hypothetical protein B0A50_01878 [Salinomyces thailandicus]|uniref:PEBP-like protein n=1 Tax=Salinomyces thailandicus TaxID=706561 RepID=A0A4V5N5H1_9PEZI|nr:hypothetical protein B0A50_01878 [Salinomyces thailandica]